ncbi:MAG: hypothetical protein FJ004_09140 [Chloroflexi bacterium]|nr:hypothetical protein [Chloroflexota bacterium]
MPKLPKGKKAICVYIEAEFLTKFIEMVKRNNEGFFGLSAEVEDALRSWYAIKNTHHDTQIKLNPSPKSYAVMRHIKEYLKQKYGGFTPQQVSSRDLKEAISAIRGNDRRTISKWLREFLKYGQIKVLNPNVYELL